MRAKSAPVVVDDAARTLADMPVTINVLANDTELDGGELTVDGVTQPVDGTVTITATSAVFYRPDSGFTGTDTFSYTASNADSESAIAQVHVTVSPADASLDAPSDLSVLDMSASEFTFSWMDNSTGEDGFRIYRSEGGAYSEVGTTTFTVYADDTVSAGTTYTYIVVAYTASGESAATSPLTMVAEDPYVTLTSLTGGEVLTVGETYSISWETNTPFFDARILLSLDDGGSWDVILASYAPNSSPFNWVVGNDHQGNPLVSSTVNTCIVRIQHYETALGISDTSSSTFTIQPAEEDDDGDCAAGRSGGAQPLGYAACMLACAAFAARRRATASSE